MASPLQYVFELFVLLYSVVIHEVSHGLAANAMGDTTAKDMGRLSLNPIRHLDMFGSIILPLALKLLGSPFIVGYAKPVPYNPNNLDDRRYGPAKVALAGPLSNIALAVLFGLVLRFLPDIFSSSLMPLLLAYIVYINLLLALFNLFPVPPLDGHWLLMTLLPERFAVLKVTLYRFSFLFLVIFILFIFPFLFPLISFLFRLITGLPGLPTY